MKHAKASCIFVFQSHGENVEDLMFKLTNAYSLSGAHDCSLYLDKTANQILDSIIDIQLGSSVDKEVWDSILKYHHRTIKFSQCNLFLDLFAADLNFDFELESS